MIRLVSYDVFLDISFDFAIRNTTTTLKAFFAKKVTATQFSSPVHPPSACFPLIFIGTEEPEAVSVLCKQRGMGEFPPKRFAPPPLFEKVQNWGSIPPRFSTA